MSRTKLSRRQILLSIAGAMAAVTAALGASGEVLGAVVSAAISSSLSFYVAIPKDDARASLRFDSVESSRERVRVKVENDGPAVATACEGKISIDCAEEDLLDVNETGSVPVFVPRGDFRQIRRMSVSWEKRPISSKIDISKGNDENLMIARIVPTNNPTLKPFVIEIPSEEGEGFPGQQDRNGQWVERPTHARTMLKIRPEGYNVTVFVGAANAEWVQNCYRLTFESHGNRLKLVEEAAARH